MHVSEIRVKHIRVNQGLGVGPNNSVGRKIFVHFLEGFEDSKKFFQN